MSEEVLRRVSVVLIAVTVRVAAFARRKETQIMKLVGASNTYIRLPFLAEGVVAGLLGTLIAFGLLALSATSSPAGPRLVVGHVGRRRGTRGSRPWHARDSPPSWTISSCCPRRSARASA